MYSGKLYGDREWIPCLSSCNIISSLDDIIDFELDEFNMASKYDMHKCDLRYSGNPDDDVDTFISSFKTYAKLRNFTNEKVFLALQTKIHGHARIYLYSISFW